MTGAVRDIALALAVASTWLGCLGFLRLRTSLDRLHCVTFVTASAGSFLAVAGFADEGMTSRSVKLLVLIGVLLVAGAATSHAVGRSLLLRDGAGR